MEEFDLKRSSKLMTVGCKCCCVIDESAAKERESEISVFLCRNISTVKVELEKEREVKLS